MTQKDVLHLGQVLDADPELVADRFVGQVEDLKTSLTTTTHVSQLARLLDEIKAAQSEMDATLESYSTKQTFQHQSMVRSLEISRVELSTTLNHSRSLKHIMDNANSLSYKITERVRLLDGEKSQLMGVKRYVDDVKTLKTELQRAHAAIERKDWMAASRSISTIRQLPEGLINDAYVEFKVPSSTLEDLPCDVLSRWITDLEKIFTTAFNEAAATRDVAQLTYYFQLFPLLGKADVGLKCYSRFICGIISEQSREIIRNVQNQQSKPEFYAQLLFRLYQTISAIVTQHSKVIRSCYGTEVVNTILTDIQIECDLQSNLIYETYSDSKHLDRLTEGVKQYGYPILIQEIYRTSGGDDSEDDDLEEEQGLEDGAEGEDDGPESTALIEASQVTDELSAMMNHWSMYSKFFVVVWNEYTSPADKRDLYPTPLILSSFGIKIQDKIISQFDTCCTYIIRRTLEKACIIETQGDFMSQFSVCLKFLTLVFRKIENSSTHSLYSLIPEDPPISSLADDMIIALNTILLEVLATGELSSIKNMVSNIKRILQNDLLNIIQQRLKFLKLGSSSNLLTKDTIQKIHQQKNQSLERSYADAAGSRSRSSTPIGLNVSASDIASTGAMFMKSLNAAISYTMAGEGDSESYLIGDDADLKLYVVYLNTLEVMSTYLSKLVGSCLERFNFNSLLVVDDQKLGSIRKSLDQTSNNYNTKFDMVVPPTSTIQTKIEGLLKSIPDGFRESSDPIIENNVKIIFDRVVRARVIKLVNNAVSDSYIVTIEDGQYYSIEVDSVLNSTPNNNTNKLVLDGSKITAFIKNWNSLIVPYATTLANPVFNRLVTKIVELSASILETKLWALERKVTSVGTIKLEQDVSTIISELTKFNYGLRSKFIKATQIIMVAGLDEEEEVAALADPDSGVEWSLTPSERARSRRLRSI